jgi:hypothetical protein
MGCSGNAGTQVLAKMGPWGCGFKVRARLQLTRIKLGIAEAVAVGHAG